jgi:hypothetical protein
MKQKETINYNTIISDLKCKEVNKEFLSILSFLMVWI